MTKGKPMKADSRLSYIQQKLLAEVPVVPGLDLAVSWQPAGEVGGDFYDFLLLEEDSVGLVLGDVAGRGLDAALLMVFALAEIRARLSSHQRLLYIMGELDRSLRQHATESSFCEVLLGTYSVPRRRLTFVQGGGIVPLVFHASTQRLSFYQSQSYRLPGLGIAPGAGRRFVEETIELEEQDVLLLLTDGVTERVDSDGAQIVRRDAFGALVAPSLQKLFQSIKTQTASEITSSLVAYLDSIQNERTDDATFLVLKPSLRSDEGRTH